MANPYWFKSAILTLMQRYSVLFFGFGSVYFIVRSLDESEFGVWQMFLVVSTLIEMARNGLVQNGTIKHFISSKDDKDLVISASFWLNIFFTIVTNICLLLVVVVLNFFKNTTWNMIGPVLIIFIFTNFIMAFASHYNYIQQAHSSFKGIFFSTFIRQSIFFSLILVFFLTDLNLGLQEFSYFLLIGTIFGAISSFYHTRPMGFMEIKYKMNRVGELGKYGFFSLGTNVGSILFKSVDQLMLGLLMTPMAVGTYGMALRFSNLVEYPATAISDIAFPKSAEKLISQGIVGVKELYEKSVGLLLVIIIPIVIGVFIVSDWIIAFYAGPAYSYSADILKITICFGLITPFNRQFGMVMDSIGKPQINFKLTGFSLIINIISNFVMIRHFGVIGAAYGTLLSYLVSFSIGQFILKKSMKVNILNCFKNMRVYVVQIIKDPKSIISK